MARPLLNDIVNNLLTQNYEPKTQIFYDNNFGTVETVIKNITDNSYDVDGKYRYDNGPFVVFVATNLRTKEVLSFESLVKALEHIGLTNPMLDI